MFIKLIKKDFLTFSIHMEMFFYVILYRMPDTINMDTCTEDKNTGKTIPVNIYLVSCFEARYSSHFQTDRLQSARMEFLVLHHIQIVKKHHILSSYGVLLSALNYSKYKSFRK